jgi:hypothetical protein
MCHLTLRLLGIGWLAVGFAWLAGHALPAAETVNSTAATPLPVLSVDHDLRPVDSLSADHACDDCPLCRGLDGLQPDGSSLQINFGGQYRARHQSERNIRGLGLTGVDDDFLLHRTRLHADARLGQRFKAYAEMIDAESNYENFPPRSIEVNRGDMLNLYGEGLLFGDAGGDALWLRVGRQELVYGSQRLVSPLDWGNTRRTFEGVKAYWQGRDWNLDAFWTRPVIVDTRNFDSPHQDQEFMGLFGSFHGWESEQIDVYFLKFNDGASPNLQQISTIGSRWYGESRHWLGELEGAVQFGDNTDGSERSAGFVTAGVGHRFPALCGSPVVWFYYDWASGTDDRGAAHGFHHLFPLAHRYLGFMDLFGRSNIESPNVLATWQLGQRLKLTSWYYYFFLENKNDTPYTVAMTPINAANAPRSADLGQELDLLLSWQLARRAELQFGYSHFFTGRYFADTAGVPYRGDADFFYTQFTVDF